MWARRVMTEHGLEPNKLVSGVLRLGCDNHERTHCRFDAASGRTPRWSGNTSILRNV